MLGRFSLLLVRHLPETPPYACQVVVVCSPRSPTAIDNNLSNSRLCATGNPPVYNNYLLLN